MNTQKNLIAPILLSLAFFQPGCGDPAPAPTSANNVAVIDLDEVAKRTGLTNQMSGSMKQAEDQLNAQLKQIQGQFQQQLQEKNKELEAAAEDAKDKVKEELAMLNRQLNQKLSAIKSEAQQKLSMHTQGLIGNVREILRPKVTEVAKENGFQIVLTANKDVIFSFEPAADITQKVVDRLLKEAMDKKPAAGGQPATTAPSAPASSPAAAAPEPAASSAAPAAPASPEASPASPSPAGP